MRRPPLRRTRCRLMPQTQGKKKEGMEKSAQRPKSRRRRVRQSCRKHASQKQALVHKFKSLRVLRRGCYTKYYDKGDGLESVVAFCGKENSYGEEYQNDGSVEDEYTDTGDDDKDDTTWKPRHDKDWVPKPYSKDQMHNVGNVLDSIMSCKQTRGVIGRGASNHSNDEGSEDNRDHDHVIPRKCTYNVHHFPQKIAENGYHCHRIDDDDHHDPDATDGQSYVNSANDTIFQMDEDYPQTQNMGYVRRKRSVNKRGPPRDGSDCPTSTLHLARRLFLCSKEAVFPSWKNKKPRVIGTKQDKARKVFNMDTSPPYQLEGPHVTVMPQKQEELTLPTRPNSFTVFSNGVRKDFPKEFAESELTSSLHSDAASTNQPLNTTDGAKRSLPSHTQEETIQDKIGNEKNQGPLAKTKRKKYQPKVPRDIFQKAKSTLRISRKKKPAARKKRQAKKGQDAGDSTTESSTKSRKQQGRKQGRAALTRASSAFEDDNLGTKSPCTFNAESCLVPFQTSVFSQESQDQESRNSSLQSLTVKDVASLHDLLANKAELSILMHMASFTPELTEYMQENELHLYGQFFGQPVPRFISESQVASSLKSIKKFTSVFDTLSPVNVKPDGFTQPLLTQEPHDQLEMVVYNQKSELVVLKSAKSRVKIRAQVQLDAESERMWPLLASGGIPREFEDASHLEREASIMEKHVRLFIHNMQAVQGDRHFSPWKGSILDSVVGAFLTQNVSDHLSSSAFMCIAARYPSRRRNNTEITNLSNDTLNGENQTAREMSNTSHGAQNATWDVQNPSSGSVVEESSSQQENRNAPTLDNPAKLNTCFETTRCIEGMDHCLSLRGVKSLLRNHEASQPIDIRDIDDKSDSLTPTGTCTAVTDEDSVQRCGILPLDGNVMEQILLEQGCNSSSNLEQLSNQPVSYMRQRDMHHLLRASSHLMEGNVSIKSNDNIASVNSDINLTVDPKGLRGSEHIYLPLPIEQDDTAKKPRLSHIGISPNCTGQVDIQNLEKASSPLDTLLKFCSNSISDLGHHDAASANPIGQSGMRHLENPSQSSMEEGIANEPSDNSISSFSVHHYSGQVDLQNLDRAFYSSVEEDISMNQNDQHGNSIFVKQDHCNRYNGRKECFDKESFCSLLCAKGRCDDESVSSTSKAREVVDGITTNTFLQEVGHSVAESSTLEQCTSDGNWSSPGQRTEVYSKATVCRSLFQNHVTVQINSNTTTVINSISNEEASINSDTSHTENRSAVIQESKQLACGSDNVEASPVSITAGNKRRHALSGIERAHLEESQHGRKKNHTHDWESMRRQILESCSSNEKTCGENFSKDDFQDSVDWDAVRRAPVEELAKTIKERGMHHVLSGRIKAFLKTLHEEQGDMDLEWLRKVSPENAKAYFTNIRGLGVKSVECIRLLTLHHVAFPVDVNVGRICVRLGWVPIEPLPEQLQLHLLELYPVQESIQKFLWPRLCMLDQKTLYELHYQLITFGKVFCTKSKPNCNACPMRTNCKHFASACASAKLLLKGPDNESSKRFCSGAYLSKCQLYYVEEPASPDETREPEIEEDIDDIEDLPYITKDLQENFELPYESINKYNSYTDKETHKKWEQRIKSLGSGIEASCCTTTGSHHSINIHQFSSDYTSTTIRASCSSYKPFIDNPSNTRLLPYKSATDDAALDTYADVNGGASNALVSLPEGACIPAPKLKNIDRLRTVHYVYALPDDHPLLEHADIRDTDDPSFYLLAIWCPGEAPDSLSGINEDSHEDLCRVSSITNANETVSGTLLIPCRTAMQGSFPLNGTYFQVNEVFADHASSLRPIQVPRSLIWKLQRRFVYFGTSISSIFRGLTSDEIKNCFLRGHVCVRGFDRKYKTPKPLVCRLHFPISKQIQRHKKDETKVSYRK